MEPLNKNKLAAIDPVCGEQIEPDAKSKLFMSVRGHSYYFCTENFCTEKCRTKFKQDPVKYTDALNIIKNRKTWWDRYLNID